MRWTRREFVGTAMPALIAAGAFEACTKELHAPGDEGVGGGLLLTFEGLCGFVSDRAQNPTKMDVALVSFGDDQVNDEKPRHFPTLKVSRRSLIGNKSDGPDAVDLSSAYYSLDDVEVAIINPARRDGSFQLNAAALPANAGECLKLENLKLWNNFSWVLDINECQPGAALRPDWRADRRNLRALVHIQDGIVEAAGLPTPPQDLYKVSRWKLGSGSRLLKESVRVLWPEPKEYEIQLTHRATGAKRMVALDGTNDRQKPEIINLPAASMVDHVSKAGFTDIEAFHGLLQNVATSISIPTIETLYPCNANATPDCGCCPGMRLIG